MDVEALTDATVSAAFSVVDDDSAGLTVGDLRCFLVVLSDGRLAEKLAYLFRQFSDSLRGKASRYRVLIIYIANYIIKDNNYLIIYVKICTNYLN